MWITFVIGILACTLFVYVPGFLLFRALRFSSFLSLAVAPVGSITIYGILCIFLSLFKTQTTWTVLFFGSFLLSIIFFLISHALPQQKKTLSIPHEQDNHLWLHSMLYLAISLVLTGIFFAKTLDGPTSFIAGNDATTHLNMIQAFLDTGNWSILGESYYPKGYAEVSAMVCQLLGVNAPFGTNILVAVILCAVFPLAMLGLLSFVFSNQPKIICCGCIAVLALAGYPWSFLETEQLGPNLLGYATVPLGLLFFLLAARSEASMRERIAPLIACMVFCVSCLFTHPNALFTTGTMLVPYVVYRIAIHPFPCRQRTGGRSALLFKLLSITVFLLAVCIMWICCYHLPFLASTVNFHWGAWLPINDAIKNALTLAYDNPAQWIAAPLVLIGAIYSLHKREYLWITIGAAFFACLYLLSATTDGPIKQLLTGFWYTATRRLAGASCILCIPLFAIGCTIITTVIVRTFTSISSRIHQNRTAQKAIGAATLACIAIANFFPSFTMTEPTGRVDTTFGYVFQTLASQNKAYHSFIDQEERDFLNEVKEQVGDDLVFNIPYDGSAYAYALSQVNTVLKNLRDSSSDDGLLLQEHLNSIATDTEVQRAAKDARIRYVLLLDNPLGEDSSVYWKKFNQENWSGTLAIDENTEGFELIASKGDMKLFKIDPNLLQ